LYYCLLLPVNTFGLQGRNGNKAKVGGAEDVMGEGLNGRLVEKRMVGSAHPAWFPLFSLEIELLSLLE
jgi:hypothetical protein